MVLQSDKREAQRQWDANPCGINTVDPALGTTAEFYRAARDYRYQVYGPWFDGILDPSISDGKDVLEIGVGLGSDHLRLARHARRMVAVDLSREHLRHTRRHLSLEGLSTSPIYGDAECLPLGASSFDLVYSFGVLHHTPNARAAAREMHRVLRPGGRAVVALYNRYSMFSAWFHLWHGLVRGKIFTLGWKRFLSGIEWRSESEGACPLVRLYTRETALRLFAGFSSVRVHSCHVFLGKFHRQLHIPRSRIEASLNRMGWYLVVDARK